MANKERYTVGQVVNALNETKGMMGQAARRLGCHHDTITNYAKRHASVKAAITQSREEMTDAAELALYNAVTRGEAWAVCFYLKTQGKKRGYVERQELTGAEGGPFVIRVKGLSSGEMPGGEEES